MKGRAADSGTGDDVSMPPFGPGSDLPSFREPAGSERSTSLPEKSSKATPLAAAALVVCIAAFVLGLIPALGAVLGAAGIVLVVLAVRRGESTKRSIVGGVLAGIAVLASVTTTILLVGAVTLSGDLSSPDPVAEAPVVGNENDEEPGPRDDPVEPTPTPEDEPTSEEPVTEASPSAEPDPTTESAPTTESSPTTEPAPTEVPEADLSEFEELDERSLAQIVKAPDDHIGRQVILYGTITQLDAATGPCFVRVSIAHAPQDDWYDYDHNSVGFAGDGESECPVLGPLVADDEVKLWVTIGGSLSYDTQIGGSATVPAYLIAEAELV